METIKCANGHECIHQHCFSYVTCRGPCGKSYHSLCADLQAAQVLALSESLFWLCSDCSEAFKKWKSDLQTAPADSHPSPVEIEVTELKHQVANILDTLATLTSKFSTSTPVSSNPVASSTLFNGTNENSREFCCATDSNNSDTSRDSNKSFALLLTNVINCVSEEEMGAIVSRCLGAPKTECRHVKKLVSKWVDCNTLDYVSFKIVLPEKWKCQALTASTWPRGIKFREFHSRSNCPWKPDFVYL